MTRYQVQVHNGARWVSHGPQHLNPAAVELPVTGAIAVVLVRGIVDTIDTLGAVIDLKTANTIAADTRNPPALVTTLMVEL